jgi:membrane protease subunit HflK
MTEPENKNRNDLPASEPKGKMTEEMDAAGRSLSEALRISFIILKVIMVVLVIAFLASGFKTVGSDERALVLRFGRIRGVGEARLLGPGPHWIFPYPVDEIIKIKVEKKVNLATDAFWYFQTEQEKLTGQKRPVRPDTPLDPKKDGYCLTRSEWAGQVQAVSDVNEQNSTASRGRLRIRYNRTDVNAPIENVRAVSVPIGTSGSDYNIVHSKWQLTYQIDDPERFFKDILVDDVKPDETYFDVATRSVTPLLKDLLESAVVSTMVNYTIDEAISSKASIPDDVKKLMQDMLDDINSGIKVVSVYLTDVTWPRQVDDAFLASIKASNTRQKTVTEAQSYAENTIREAAGPVAEKLFNAIHDNTMSEKDKDLLWSQAAGQAQKILATARAYRTQVVESARANADYLESLLPEYKKHPKLVIQRIYLDAVEQVLNDADEKFIIQPTEGTKGSEIRVMMSRDATIKPKSAEKTTENKENTEK